MDYGTFQDLPEKKKVLLTDKTFNIAKNPKYDGYQTGLETGINSDVASSENKQLAEELHEPIIAKFETCKVHSSFKENIWGADLADTQ